MNEWKKKKDNPEGDGLVIALMIFAVIAAAVLIGGTGCYQTREAAWEACDDKYNGKCEYLGPKFRVCEE